MKKRERKKEEERKRKKAVNSDASVTSHNSCYLYGVGGGVKPFTGLNANTVTQQGQIQQSDVKKLQSHV